MGLFSFKPIWMTNKNRKALKAIAAVEKETNQVILNEIIDNAPLSSVRCAAVNKISDQLRLAGIANNNSDGFMRSVAVQKLTDQSLLAEIAQKSNYTSVRELAMKKLLDQTILVSIVKNDTESAVRITALNIISKQELLADIAKHKYMYFWDMNEIGKIALQKLTDITLIVDVAKNAQNFLMKIVALEMLTDQSMIRDIAINAEDKGIRNMAMKKLTDQSTLANIALDNSDNSEIAVSYITDKSLLVKIVQQTRNIIVKKKAMLQLGGYICMSCGNENWPDGERVSSCICDYCQSENHEFEHVNNVIEHRDYESGVRWDECVRCGKKENVEVINTM